VCEKHFNRKILVSYCSGDDLEKSSSPNLGCSLKLEKLRVFFIDTRTSYSQVLDSTGHKGAWYNTFNKFLALVVVDGFQIVAGGLARIKSCVIIESTFRYLKMLLRRIYGVTMGLAYRGYLGNYKRW